MGSESWPPMLRRRLRRPMPAGSVTTMDVSVQVVALTASAVSCSSSRLSRTLLQTREAEGVPGAGRKTQAPSWAGPKSRPSTRTLKPPAVAPEEVLKAASVVSMLRMLVMVGRL
jgi:hypothetical protein